MKIRVFAPPFVDLSRIDEDGFVEIAEGSDLDDVLKLLKVPLRRGAVLFTTVNHEKAPLSRVLSEGDTVSFFSLVGGG